jgi:hypothetical protein
VRVALVAGKGARAYLEVVKADASLIDKPVVRKNANVTHLASILLLHHTQSVVFMCVSVHRCTVGQHSTNGGLIDYQKKSY